MTPPPDIEIEAKLPVDDLGAVERRLIEVGAEPLGPHHQHDRYFDSDDGTLASSDRCLRLRRQQAPSGPLRWILTYKGPKQRGAFKRRLELQTVLQPEQAETLAAVLAALSYRPVLEVRKVRSLWHWRACAIGLDNVHELGTFVEIEGPDEPTIAAVQAALGLERRPHEPRSYACLLQERRGPATPPGPAA